MKGKRAYRHVKFRRIEIHVFDCKYAVFDRGIVGAFFRTGNHILGQVYPHHRPGQLFARVSAMPAEAASDIEHPFAAQLRHQRTEYGPFPGGIESSDRTGHLAVFCEKSGVIVFVLFHNRQSPICRTYRLSGKWKRSS
jgi:hypothetical protein